MSIVRVACAAAAVSGAAPAFGAEPAAGEQRAGAPAWSWSLTATQYWLPQDPDFLLGVATADRGALHLEARWQYEDLRSVSIFAGWKFSAGNELRVEVTPIFGPVLGRTNGLVPGLELDVSFRRLRLYTEDEFVFVPNDSGASYFYAWTELTASPFDFLTLGVVGQRTRLVQTSREIQPGLLGRLSFRGITLGVGVFNPATADWYVSTGLTIER